MMKAIVGIVLGAALGTAAYASDVAANAVYQRMQSASSAADPAALLERVYAPEATYLPGQAELGIEPREAVLKMLASSQLHLRKSGGEIDLKFRVVSRKRFGDICVDNGFMRTAVRPSKNVPAQVTFAKFVTVIARQPDGHWAFITDADSETPAANFENAKPVPGLKFDH